ncbi:MAG: T9SS type A sorting domain-containing protein [Chitinispirillaceae bacterium]|nr:T9SS type A sorting domain-containing protein [Chitinispirillaceae bacterium]
MKGKLKTVSLWCFAVVWASFGEVIQAESDVFTFPPITGIVAKNTPPQRSFFRHSGLRPYSRAITFSWAFPGSPAENNGTIAVYSLLGKVVAKIPVRGKTGTATWRLASAQCGNGIFIARIVYGDTARNLKLMLWN